MLELDNVLVTRPRPGVLLVTLNRPKRYNALTFPMFDTLAEICRTAEADETARAIVVTGEGRGFCSGLDLDLAESLPACPPRR